MLGQRQEDSVFIERELGLPAEWLSTSLALCEQNFNLYEAAMAEWHKAGNPQQAHYIWHEKILPLYMNRSARVSLVKAL